MGESWVINASPLIALAKVGQLELLTGLSQDMLLPEPVVQEILAGPAADPARIAIAAGWGRRVLADRTAPQVLEWSLGAGESAVLTVAMEDPHRRAVLDDARDAAAPERSGFHSSGLSESFCAQREPGSSPRLQK